MFWKISQNILLTFPCCFFVYIYIILYRQMGKNKNHLADATTLQTFLKYIIFRLYTITLAFYTTSTFPLISSIHIVIVYIVQCSVMGYIFGQKTIPFFMRNVKNYWKRICIYIQKSQMNLRWDYVVFKL